MPNIFSFIKSYSEFVELSENDKGYQRTMEWSKIKLVVTITFNGWHPWTIVLESAILDVSAILDPSPHLHSLRKKFFKIMESNFSIALCDWTFSKNFFFFLFGFSFTNIHNSRDTKGKRPFLTPLHQLHLLQRHWHIIRTIFSMVHDLGVKSWLSVRDFIEIFYISDISLWNVYQKYLFKNVWLAL